MSPFCTILRYPFLMIDPQNYDGRPIYTNFEGECAEKKRNFSVNFFQKVPKNAFFGLFLSKLTKFSKVNENSNPPPPLRENPRSAPDQVYGKKLVIKISYNFSKNVY